MNDSEQGCVQLFWWIQEINPHIEIDSTLHKKWMILSRVLFSIFNGFMAIFYFIGKCEKLGEKWVNIKSAKFKFYGYYGKLPLKLAFTMHDIWKKLFLSQIDPTISVDSIKCNRDGNFAQNHVINVWDQAAFSSASSASW